MSLRAVRLSGLLVAASVVLHEGAYALGGGGLIAAHHYLEVAIPLVAALAASVVLATLVAPSLGVVGEEPRPHEPFALAAALLGIFAFQETIEATLLGAGMQVLMASASVAWLAPPLALVLGALVSALITTLERVGQRLATAPAHRLEHPSAAFAATPAPIEPRLRAAACCGLAFGFSRRPPPASA